MGGVETSNYPAASKRKAEKPQTLEDFLGAIGPLFFLIPQNKSREDVDQNGFLHILKQTHTHIYIYMYYMSYMHI